MDNYYQFISMFANFSRKIFRDVNVRPFKQSSFSQNFLLVSIVDETNLDRFVATEIRPEADSRDSAHRNISSNVQFLAQHLLDLNKEKTRKIVRTFFDYLYWSSFFNSSLDVYVGIIKYKNVFYQRSRLPKAQASILYFFLDQLQSLLVKS